jgi:hypothetical protein
MKRSQLSDGAGVPMATVSAPANTRDDALLGQTLDALKGFQPLPAEVTVHLDAGYDYRPCRAALEERGLLGEIAARGTPAPNPGGQAVAGGADQLLVQRLRQAPPLHRTPPRLRRRIPRPGRRHRHRPCAMPGCLAALPLGLPTTITTHPLTYWRGL